jgi:putative transposase
MPDHVHLLITTADLTTAIQRIKGGFSRKLGSKLPVWQRGFADHLILTRNSSTAAATTSTKTPSAPTSANSRRTTPTPPRSPNRPQRLNARSSSGYP